MVVILYTRVIMDSDKGNQINMINAISPVNTEVHL